MEIRIVAVGRMKGDFKYLQVGVDEYVKRMKPYARVSIAEVPDETVTASRTREQIMENPREDYTQRLIAAPMSRSSWARCARVAWISFCSRRSPISMKWNRRFVPRARATS